MKTRIDANRCLRCGHVWVSRKKRIPLVCPSCHSPYWQRKKVNKHGCTNSRKIKPIRN